MLVYILGITNGATRGLQIGAGFKDCKSGQEGLQIRPAQGISNRGKKITNRGRDYKSVQNKCNLNIFN